MRLANNSSQVVPLERTQPGQIADDEFVVADRLQSSLASVGNGVVDVDAAPVDAAEAQRRLQEYLLEHANNASQQRAQGIVPFARVASFETE